MDDTTGGHVPRDGRGRIHAAQRPVYLRRWFIAAAAALSGIVVGFAIDSRPAPPAPLQSPSPSARSASPPARILDGDGTYRIGPGAHPPGRYRSSPTSTLYPCYWTRLGRQTDAPSPAISSGYGHTGPVTVYLTDGDTFMTLHCGRWTLQPPPAPRRTPLPPGGIR